MESPLVTLVVPVWGDDVLLIDQIQRLELVSESAEWVVAAIEPSEALRDLGRNGKICLIVCEKP
ncbi:MAG TPA: hypothetical protein VIT23_16240, partial [Terrimicrobiaceae bacterium]